MSLARLGDRACFEELVRRRQSHIRNLLRRLCRDPGLADDLSQQTFLDAWRRLAALREPDAFGAWLRRIALNQWLQHLRRTKPAESAFDERCSESLAVGEPAGSRGGHANALRELPAVSGPASERIDLDRALAQLPAMVRLCIVLAHAEGMSHPEIAATLELPLGTVKSHIARGTARLRQLLAAYE